MFCPLTTAEPATQLARAVLFRRAISAPCTPKMYVIIPSTVNGQAKQLSHITNRGDKGARYGVNIASGGLTLAARHSALYNELKIIF